MFKFYTFLFSAQICYIKIEDNVCNSKDVSICKRAALWPPTHQLRREEYMESDLSGALSSV